ncbi:SRPBCC family protein [Uliginosibacterium sp. 31-16]|uniref:SRPBCC family protein n=1 Tax=Uliginosibacterium sp. 31-16 TaxID=3068315 RepID=UPI00273EF5ED|nr:SRPBCC family protein [Uliginosibacterium sp. 31-16]MDP5239839.1 SRPBCC family protein [Uliginosibacterium sp. 31-16]
MNTTESRELTGAPNEIRIERVLEAPRELVWAAMTDPQQVGHWWGPNGFTMTIRKMDVRVGGVWDHTLHGPDGTNYPNNSVFREVVAPERIVYAHEGVREDGPAVNFVATWTFEDLGNTQTRLTICMVFDSAQARELVVREFGAIEGGKQTLGRLADYLSRASRQPA